MPSRKDIKRRISSVSTTKQVMKAMDMVAGAKLQKVKVQLEAARPLAKETARIIDNIKNCDDALENIYVMPRKVKNTAYVVITGDRGLCGGYNTNISQSALAHMNGKNEKIIAVGLQGLDFFKRRGKRIVSKYSGLSETAFYENAHLISSLLMLLYKSHAVDEAFIAYTRFDSALSHTPQIAKVLPLGEQTTVFGYSQMQYECGVDSFLEHALPIYLNAMIYAAIVESSTSEQAARMLNMDSAVSNASDIIENLTKMYNRKRQAVITQEIGEIVNAANALET